MWLAFTGSLGTSLGVDVCEIMSKYSARISDSVMMSPKNAPTNCQNTRPLSISIHHYPPWASPLRLTTSRSLRSLKPLAVENIRHHEAAESAKFAKSPLLVFRLGTSPLGLTDFLYSSFIALANTMSPRAMWAPLCTDPSGSKWHVGVASTAVNRATVQFWITLIHSIWANHNNVNMNRCKE